MNRESDQSESSVTAKADQSDGERLRSTVQAQLIRLLGQKLSIDAQRTVSNLVSLIDNLHSNEMGKYETQITSTVAALAAPDPNIIFADKTITAVDNSLMARRGVFSRAVFRCGNNICLPREYGQYSLSTQSSRYRSRRIDATFLTNLFESFNTGHIGRTTNN